MMTRKDNDTKKKNENVADDSARKVEKDKSNGEENK